MSCKGADLVLFRGEGETLGEGPAGAALALRAGAPENRLQQLSPLNKRLEPR